MDQTAKKEDSSRFHILQANNLGEDHQKGFVEGQEDFRLLVNSIKDYGIFMLDPTGKILTWNEGAERLKGYKANEVIGTHFSRFYTQYDRERAHPARELYIAAQTGKYEEEGWRVKKDGSTFWANVVITALRDKDGKLRGFGKITRDLTERRQVELALRESEELFRLMIETVKDYAIFMIDPKGFIVSWNQGAERIKGWKASEVIGRHFSVFYTPEDVRSGKIEHELEAAEREGRYEDFGWRVKKDGSKIWANVVITALRDDKGVLRGYSKVTRDITDRKQAELDLKNAYEDLERRVEDKTKALKLANSELESFSYSISHDLRAPLRSMDGFSQALLNYYGGKLDHRGKDFLRRIRESSKRMGHLIEDILNLSKLGRTDLHKMKVNLSEIAEKVVLDLKRNEPTRDIKYSIAPKVEGFCDPNLIRLVFENLLGNSWKYSSGKTDVHIEFGVVHEDKEPVYFIKDNGAGFDMTYSDKLFGAFQRLHSDQEFPGTGIGLASVKRIVQRHGGDVWAEGELGKGAIFYFTLAEEGPKS